MEKEKKVTPKKGGKVVTAEKIISLYMDDVLENGEVPKSFSELEKLRPDDTEKEINYFSNLFYEILSLFTSPFNGQSFDFSDEAFWEGITELSEKYSKDTELRKMNGNRGSKHFLYINRTFFGLYNLLHDLKAEVKINRFKEY